MGAPIDPIQFEPLCGAVVPNSTDMLRIEFLDSFVAFEVAINRWLLTGNDNSDVERASVGHRYERLLRESATDLTTKQRAGIESWCCRFQRILEIRNAISHGIVKPGMIEDRPVVLIRMAHDEAANRPNYLVIPAADFPSILSQIESWRKNLEGWFNQREQRQPKPGAIAGS